MPVKAAIRTKTEMAMLIFFDGGKDLVKFIN
jgi:hypothetical protein